MSRRLFQDNGAKEPDWGHYYKLKRYNREKKIEELRRQIISFRKCPTIQKGFIEKYVKLKKQEKEDEKNFYLYLWNKKLDEVERGLIIQLFECNTLDTRKIEDSVSKILSGLFEKKFAKLLGTNWKLTEKGQKLFKMVKDNRTKVNKNGRGDAK